MLKKILKSLLIPTRQQFNNWSLPSKLTFFGFWLTVAIFLGTLVVNHIMNKCEMKINSKSRIVSRRYLRDKIENVIGKGVRLPQFHELFYEISTEILANRQVKEIVVQIDNLMKDDRIKFDPEDGVCSDLEPKWFSGFNEPKRNRPHYYSKICRFLNENTGQIVVRRPLLQPAITTHDLLEVKVKCRENCHIKQSVIDANREISRLNYQIIKLNTLPLGEDPGDVTGYDLQATIEVTCSNDNCDRFTMKQLEANSGVSPNEYYNKNRIETNTP